MSEEKSTLALIKNNAKLIGGVIGVEEKFQSDNKLQC